jgi:hypothetical protein
LKENERRDLAKIKFEGYDNLTFHPENIFIIISIISNMNEIFDLKIIKIINKYVPEEDIYLRICWQ